jgi:hypothetical protein
MRIYEALFIVLAGCFIVYLAIFYGQTEARVYACSEIGYPVAIDVPKEVIEMCRKAIRWQQN